MKISYTIVRCFTQEMKIFFDENQLLHAPKHEFTGNGLKPYPERPDRINWILEAIEASKLELEISKPEPIDSSQPKLVHTDEYVNFLQKIPRDLKEDAPTMLLVSEARNLPSTFHGNLGRFFFDPATPITASAYTSALGSVSSALAATKDLESNNISVALCRPPGHHATRSHGGGYCFFNNVAIAAELLNRQGKTVSILDVDFHHGNGTQEIFYTTDKVQYISIHADPDSNYPFFWGSMKEIGSENGRGFNLNFPIENTCGEDDYIEILTKSIAELKEYNADVVLISMGFDTYYLDPIAGLNLDVGAYNKMGELLSDFNHIAIILEGGYHQNIGKCFVELLRGLS